MQKLIITSVSVLVSMFQVSVSQAVENNYRPYLGLDYAYDASSAHPHYNSVRAVLGSVYNPYFGTEVFYQYSDKDEMKPQGIRNASFNAYGLDMLAYLPLGDSGVAPLLAAGIGQYTFKSKYADGAHNNDHGWGYRLGTGLQYDIDSNWAVRAIVRYVKTDKISAYKHLNEYTLGIRYTF